MRFSRDMMRITSWITFACSPGIVVLLPCLGWTNPVVESFETGFGSWSPQAFLNVPDPAWQWSVVRSDLQASQGAWSVQLTASGVHDDGTIWVERSLELPAGEWEVKLGFDLWSPADADIGTWQKIAFIGTTNPESESQFTVLGLQDFGGWHPYSYSVIVSLPNQTSLWLACGVNIVFENVRTYYVDAAIIQWSLPRPVHENTWGAIKALYR